MHVLYGHVAQLGVSRSKEIRSEVVRKADARTRTLTKEQYLSVSTKH